MQFEFLICRTTDATDLPLPRYMTNGAAGLDLYANVHEDIIISKGEIKLIPTGVKIALPEGFEAQIRPRSGLALKNGITMLNSPGTIDADYRGEIKLIVINHMNEDFRIHRGLRMAQMVINKFERVSFIEAEMFSETERGQGGFGHTGK